MKKKYRDQISCLTKVTDVGAELAPVQVRVKYQLGLTDGPKDVNGDRK